LAKEFHFNVCLAAIPRGGATFCRNAKLNFAAVPKTEFSFSIFYFRWNNLGTKWQISRFENFGTDLGQILRLEINSSESGSKFRKEQYFGPILTFRGG